MGRETFEAVVQRIRVSAARYGVAEARALANAEEALAKFNAVGNEAMRLADADRANSDQWSGISDQNGNRFVIREEVTSDDGKTYENVVFLDSDVLKNTNRHNRNKVFTDYVRNNFAGVSIPVYNENGEQEIISFAKKNERVLKDGATNKHKVLDKLATKRKPVEMSVVLNSEEVLQTSRENGRSDDHSHQWLDQNGWKFRTAYVQTSDGKLYAVNLNIAQARDGRNIFYDVNDTKKIGVGNVPSSPEQNSGRSQRATTTDYDGSVSQPTENVNTSDMKFMVRETNDGRKVAAVDRDILAGVPEGRWRSTIKAAILKYRPVLYSGDMEIDITSNESASEWYYSNSAKKLRKAYSKTGDLRYPDKLRALNQLDDVLSSSGNYKDETKNHEREDSIKSFKRGSVLLDVGGRQYTAEVILAVKAKGNPIFYDIEGIQPTSFEYKTVPSSKKGRAYTPQGAAVALDNGTGIENISQESQDVNTFGMKLIARESDYYLPEDEEETPYNGEKDFRLTERYREALTGMGYDRTDDQIVRMDPESEAGENRGNVPAYNKYPPRDEQTRRAMDRISKTSRPNPRDMEKVASSFDQADTNRMKADKEIVNILSALYR